MLVDIDQGIIIQVVFSLIAIIQHGIRVIIETYGDEHEIH
jgi:hypothetical protein